MRFLLKTAVLTALTLGFVAPPAAFASSVPHRRPQAEIELNQKLTVATEHGDVAQMRKLLALGADPNWRRTNVFQYPLLLIAVLHGGPQAVELLLRSGANPNARDLRGTPVLVSAASFGAAGRAPYGLFDSVRLLLDLGHANPNLHDTARIGDGRNALHMAAAVGSRGLVELLIARGANPNQPNRVNETPLHLASQNGQVEAAEALISAGANPNVRSRFTGMTPLLAAAGKGQSQMVRVLIARSANPHVRDTFGDTPLTLARTGARKARADERMRVRFTETVRILEIVTRAPANG